MDFRRKRVESEIFFGLKKELCKMKEFEMKVNESLSFDDI